MPPLLHATTYCSSSSSSSSRQPGTAALAPCPGMLPDTAPGALGAMQGALSVVQLMLDLHPATLRDAIDRENLQLDPLVKAAAAPHEDASSDPALAQAASQLSTQLFLLLGRLLEARPEPSDWTAAFCRCLSAVLAASQAVCRTDAGLRAAVAAGISSDTLSRLAAAQAKVTFVLTMQPVHACIAATSAQLKQMQPQPQPDALGVPAALLDVQQQLDQLQLQVPQQGALLDTATALLGWCAAARWLWAARDSSTGSFALRSVQMAATAARCPHSPDWDSHSSPLSTTASGGSSAAVPRAVCSAVHGVADRALLLVAKARPQGSCALRDQLLLSNNFMSLCLALLLTVSALLLRQAEAGHSSRGGSAGSSSSSSGGGSSSSSSSSSSNAVCGEVGTPAAAAQQPDDAGRQQQQQHQQQGTAAAQKPSPVPPSMLQVWQAAGFPPADLPGWIDAVHSMLQDGTLLQASCAPSTHPGGSSSSRAGSSEDSSSTSSSSAGSAPPAFRQLPGTAPLLQRAFVLLAQVLAQCVLTWVRQRAHVQGFDYQRTLLEKSVWQLPQLLLQTALVCGAEEPLVTEVAADAAWCCADCWQLPALQPVFLDDNDGAAAGDKGRACRQVLPPLLDCWLQLMQQHLLQPGSGLLHAAFAAGQGQHNHQPPAVLGAAQDAAGAAAATGALPQIHPLCGCCPGASSPEVWVQPDTPCVMLDCRRCCCVSALVDMLAALAAPIGLLGSSSRLPAVLLLLEVLLRRVGSLGACCSSSSSGDGPAASSSRSSSKLSSGALLMMGSCENALGTVMRQMVHSSSLLQPAVVRSAFAAATAWYKLFRCPGTLLPDIEERLASAQPAGQLHMLEAVQAMSSAQVQACSSLSEVRAVLAPWVVLLAQFVNQTTGQLLQCSPVTHSYSVTETAADGGEGGRVGVGQSSTARGAAPAARVCFPSGWHVSLAEHPRQGSILLWELLGRHWQGIGGSGSAGSRAPPRSRRTAGSQQQQQQQHQQQQEHAHSATSPSATTAGAGKYLPAAYLLQHCDLAAESSRLAAVVRAVPDAISLCGMTRALEEMQQLGAALCAKLPVPWLCNNPGCKSMAGASELQLVGGKACVCGSCRVARYCGRSCQAAHWAQHSPACKEIAACMAAAAAEAAAAVQSSSDSDSSSSGNSAGSAGGTSSNGAPVGKAAS